MIVPSGRIDVSCNVIKGCIVVVKSITVNALSKWQKTRFGVTKLDLVWFHCTKQVLDMVSAEFVRRRFSPELLIL